MASPVTTSLKDLCFYDFFELKAPAPGEIILAAESLVRAVAICFCLVLSSH